MCGIAGKISFSARSVQDRDLTAMTKTLAHRGPDDAGIYLSTDQKVGLGHRRLSIVDLSPAGHQPMSYRNQRYWIVFNGEIYNFQSLRTELQTVGYIFHSQTDTEVILALYDRYGVDCLQYLRGMFALAIYDSDQQTLFCARDRLGKKPFKYFQSADTFIFASELKAILTQPEYQTAPDYTAIHHYLTLQYCPAPFTGFQGIQKLEPAHYLLLDIKSGHLTKQRYWQLSYQDQWKLSEGEWQQKILFALEEAIRLRLIADVPIGAFLSGGIDSSAIVALMSRAQTTPVRTFSIGFTDATFNELPYARQVAQQFKTDHTEFLVKPTAIDILPELVELYEEPYADSSALPTYHVSQLTRQQVTVALTGDGGDENFAGYSRYNIQKFALECDRWGLSQLPGLRLTSQLLAQLYPTTFTHRLERFLDTLPMEAKARYANYICYFTNPMKMILYQKPYQQLLANDTYALLAQAQQHALASNALDQTLSADITTYLPEDLLVKVDIASMAHGLETRAPFLDHQFMELVAHIPFDLKLKGWRGNKHILKRTLRQLVPDSILDRPKRGFMVPIEAWFRDDLQSYVRGLLLSKHTVITREFIRREAVQQLLAQHQNTSINAAPRIWALLTLELWFRRYFA